ncbi:MAG TPA: hypothetical protein DET40_19530 [Lentisphaeria bacterium]|nr:MAG: hypothetical protein A2X45_18360 [Lentisphaerae bacterium GWF2_50_93]HCE45740.1 hypothetical protein [Lentisphaeria bacterium]
MKKTIIIFALSLFPLVHAVLSSADVKDRPKVELFYSSVLATVNGAPVTLYDVILETSNEEQKLAMIYSGAQLVKETQKLRAKKVKELVERKLCSVEFKEKEYKIPQQYVEDMLDGLAANMAGGDRKKLEKKALAEGLTLNDLRTKAHEKLAVDILVFEFCYRNVFITPKEVNDYYQKNALEFSKAPQIELQVLLLKKDGKFKDDFDETLGKITPDAVKADKEIFTTLVKLYSEGPDVAKGGNIGWLEESKLRPEFAAAIKDMGNASVAGPVQTSEGVYFIRVCDRMGARSKAFEDVRDEISEKLTKIEKEKRYDSYMNRLKEKAVIRYFIEE